MIADLKPYQAYKDSGVPWLGKVPEHWEVLPNRAIFTEIKEHDHPEGQMLSVTITKGVIRQQALLADSSKKDSSNQDKSAYKLVRPGDIAYNKMRAWQGAIGVSDFQGIVSPAYVIQRPHHGVDSRYLHYLLRTPAFAKEAERWSYGITSDMWSLRPEHFRMIYCSRPSNSEQAAIVRFLDHADRLIKRYILAKQRLIKLLEEQKHGIIHRAVTRGLDPNVRLKPSGIKWLGEVPKHWEVMPLRHLLSLGPKNGVSPTSSSSGGVLSFSISAVRDGRIRIAGNEKYVALDAARVTGFSIASGDILLVRGNGNLALVAKCGLVEQYPANCIYPDILMKIRPNSKMVAEFMVLAINSLYVSNQVPSFAKTTNGTFKISGASVRSLLVAVPPLPEQEKILEDLLRSTADIDCAIKRTGCEVALLREYRTRLIVDIVTGKLDVREAVAKLPEETDEPNPLDDVETLAEGEEETGDAALDALTEEAET
ncbi:MAG: hypothetical protein DYH03_09985 [Nitrospira sp. NTP1]|nr:hypothetical protein [Nitrospira sp. NTP1]